MPEGWEDNQYREYYKQAVGRMSKEDKQTRTQTLLDKLCETRDTVPMFVTYEEFQLLKHLLHEYKDTIK